MSHFFGSAAPFAEPLWYSRPGNPRFNESHRRLRESVRGYIESEIMPFCTQWETDGEVPSHRRSRCTATYQSACENDGLVRNSRKPIAKLRYTGICAAQR
ncbi:AF-toxin biosynthesis protein 10-1 [Alternaria alternata]|nr:AF-toxin biosynthesis protein 10-1 [Alternaria alternata]